MSALAARKQPVLVPTRSGPAIIPDQGMIQVGPAPALAAGGADPSGALAAQAVALMEQAPDGRGGAARGGALIDHPAQPAPMYADDGTGGGDGGSDVLKMLAGMGKAMGHSGGDATGPLSGPTDDGAGTHMADNSSSGGLLDKIKSLFLGDKQPAPVAAAVQTPDLTPAPMAPGALGGAAQPNIGMGDGAIPVPTPRPDLPTDVQPRQIGAGDAVARLQQTAGVDPVSAPVVPGRDPTILDRLRENPLATALIFGGLGTMSAASRPGATPLGALGQGASGGLKTAFDMDNAMHDRDLEQQKADREGNEAQSQGALRDAEAGWYKQRPALETAKTGVAQQNADSRGKTAEATMTRAQAYAKFQVGKDASRPTALMQNAKFYVDNGVAPDVKTAASMLRTGVNDATTYQRLVQAEKKVIQGSMEGMSMSDPDVERLAQDNVKARARSATGDAGGGKGGALGGAAPAQTGGALGQPAHVSSAADVAKLPPHALYINPADGLTYKKK